MIMKTYVLQYGNQVFQEVFVNHFTNSSHFWEKIYSSILVKKFYKTYTSLFVV